jgi:hypothetical protein
MAGSGGRHIGFGHFLLQPADLSARRATETHLRQRFAPGSGGFLSQVVKFVAKP